jgi:hypothetical protein
LAITITLVCGAFDFSQVRVHTDARAAQSAAAVDALAYTVGADIVFGAGQYAPRSSGGQRMLAHELTHVVQQAGGEPALGTLRIGPAEDEYERDADEQAARIVSGGSARTDRPQGQEDPTRRVDRTPRGVIRRTVTGLAVAGAAAEAVHANHFVTARNAGPTTITAATSAAGQRVNWSGGLPVVGNNLERRVPGLVARDVTVTADTPVDPGPQSVTIHVLDGRTAPAAAPATLTFSREFAAIPGVLPFGA